MKLVHLFLLLLLSISFVGCDDDDIQEPETAEDGIVGTWSAQSFTFDIEVETMSPLVNQTTESSGSAPTLDYEVTFTDDGRWMASGSYSLAVVASSNGAELLNQTTDYTSVDNQGTYTVDGDQMTINDSFFTLDFNGLPISGTGGPQTTTFTVDGNTLTFLQDEETTTTLQGFDTTTDTFSESTWTRN